MISQLLVGLFEKGKKGLKARKLVPLPAFGWVKIRPLRPLGLELKRPDAGRKKTATKTKTLPHTNFHTTFLG